MSLAVHYMSESVEHYSPPAVVAAAAQALEGIDLDPCAPAWGPLTIPAARHYRPPDQDGLSLPWDGTIYLNPPYGRRIGRWIDRLAYHVTDLATVPAAVALLPARTDTAWWSHLTELRPAVCFVRGRLRFHGPGSAGNSPFPSAIAYVGPEKWRFYRAFTDFGPIWECRS